MPAWWACIARLVGSYRPHDGHVSPARWALANKSVISRVSRPIIAFYAKGFKVAPWKLYPGFLTNYEFQSLMLPRQYMPIYIV